MCEQVVESASRLNETQFQMMFEAAPGAIILVDGQGTIIQANHQAQLMFGFSREEMVGMGVERLLPERHRASHATMRQHFIAQKQARQMGVNRELWAVRRNGVEFPVEIGLNPVSGCGDGVVIAFIIDISERRALQAKQKQLEQRLNEKAKFESLGVLAGGVAHDFNNILTAILGNAALLEMELPPSSRLWERSHVITTSASRASHICKQMLAYCGCGRFAITEADLGSLVKETLPSIQSSIGENVELVFAEEDVLPMVKLDQSQMRQVLLNLAVNAAEAIGERSGRIEIRTKRARMDPKEMTDFVVTPEGGNGEFVCLEVVDDGVGIPADDLKKVFDPFFTTKFMGRGLGLAAVQGILRRHGGGLSAHSEVGCGTTIRCFLPVGKE